MRINEIETIVRRSGQRDGEHVIFLHGNPGSGLDWEFCSEQLGAKFDLVAPDMPGFGESDRPRDFLYNVPAFTLHLQELIKRLELEKMHLVMHDMGGAWGLAYAALFPTRIKSLTLINTGFLQNYKWHLLARIWQTPLLGEFFQLMSNKPAMRAALNRANPQPLPDTFIDQMYGFQDWGHKQAVLKLYRSMKEQAASQAMMIAPLVEAEIPTLVLWGEEDIYLPAHLAHYQKEVFPHARLNMLSDCGHWPFADAPDLVTSKLKSWLST